MKRFSIGMVVAVAFLFCNNTTGPERYVWELHVPADSLPGWEEDGTRYKIYNGAILMDQMIDGGAPKYIDQGLIAGIYQVMLYDTLYECIVFVMDFGSPDRAKGMLGNMKVEVQDMPLAVPGFDASTAAASATLGGNTTYAWFDRYYIELYLSGYVDQQKSLQDAAMFLGAYRKKIGL